MACAAVAAWARPASGRVDRPPSPILEPEPNPRQASIQATLLSLQFTSDHGLLRAADSPGDWGDASQPCPKPEWTGPGPAICPISQTQGTPLTVEVTLAVSPPGTPFELAGTGSDPFSTFRAKRLVATGAAQTVALTAQAPLPPEVAVHPTTIQWSLEHPGGAQPLATLGPFRVFTTLGEPHGSVVTDTRLDWCCAQAAGETTLDGAAARIWRALAPPPGQPPKFELNPARRNTPSPLWLLMSSTQYNGQCIDLATLMQEMLQLLGGDASLGFVYGSDDADCFSTAPDAFQQRACPYHGTEKIVVHSSPDHPCVIDDTGWNNWEGVCKVGDTCYAVQLGMGSPLDVLRQWLGANQPCQGTDDWQCWVYWQAGAVHATDPAILGGMEICQAPGPFPVPVP
jgi:hypothetical protein